MLEPLLDVGIVSVFESFILITWVHVRVGDSLQVVNVIFAFLLGVLIVALISKNGLSQLDEILTSISSRSSFLVFPSFELLVCLEIPHRWALHIVWNISKLGLLGDTVCDKSDSDRIVIDVDVSIVVVVCHVPVIIEGLFDIFVVIVLKDALTTWGFHIRMV